MQGATALGIPTLPVVLTEELANDRAFLLALYHILINVHLVRGTLTCPATGRQFAVTDEIPNMIIDEEECEHVRY
jgi:multifunctional methyltransferase subunit TRM112